MLDNVSKIIHFNNYLDTKKVVCTVNANFMWCCFIPFESTFKSECNLGRCGVFKYNNDVNIRLSIRTKRKCLHVLEICTKFR